MSCQGKESPICCLCSLILPYKDTDRVVCFRTGKLLENVRNEGIRGIVWKEQKPTR